MRSRIVVAGMFATVWLAPAHAQTRMDSLSLFRYSQPVRMELLLPPDGPGASLLNPARLADGEKLYAQFGTRTSGDARGIDISLGKGFAQRFYLGAFFAGASGKFDFTNALILDNRFGFQAAYRWSLDPEGKGHVSIGLTDTYSQVNLMDRFKSTRSTPDVGMVYVPSAYPGGWRLEFGWAARDLRGFDGTAPVIDSDPQTDNYTHVDFAPWLTTGSVSASSPAQRWSLFAEAAAGARYESAYFDKPLAGWNAGVANLYLPRIGATYHPIPPISLGLERVWGRYWSLNTTLGTGNWLPFRCEADFRSAYGPYLQYLNPDRTGWSLAWNLKVIW
jgi:hypothetical protein